MSVRMFETLLIANRGEIACRIIATCRRLGIRTIAIYSDADTHSRHVRLADSAVRVGPPPARESYLNIDRILDAARNSGAQAIHPGYGFLSENAAFAEACEQVGIVFIGPPASAIRAMGSKAEAKKLVREAGVPMTPGYDGSNQAGDFLAQQADRIGYPVMIKANAGGGGKGMRSVDSAEQFASALAACRREAVAAFGDDSVLIEKRVVQPRHVEVQVFADNFGNIVSLFERDCSVQRRHQKVIEEAPAPLISAVLRQSLGSAAREAARAVNYVNAGTVEFLVDREGSFYFMEMNTRLQVEHPVTEMITGLDLIEWQLRIAAGEALPLAQDQLELHGHAIETRIYAEDPDREFMPSIGTLIHLKTPERSSHVRIDSGVEQGDMITPFYDPMIAKLIVWDETRELALKRMAEALADYQIVGVANNVGFLRRITTSPSFVDARLDTSLIERESAWLSREAEAPPDSAIILAVLHILLQERSGNSHTSASDSPWSVSDGWRLNATYRRKIAFTYRHHEIHALVEYLSAGFSITIEQASYAVTGRAEPDLTVDAVVNGDKMRGVVIPHDGTLHVFVDSDHFALKHQDPLAVTLLEHAHESSLLAPMPGRVVAHSVKPGEPVNKGDALMVLEAMKMECTIHAPCAGSVQEFLFAPGVQVTEGAELLLFEREKSDIGDE